VAVLIAVSLTVRALLLVQIAGTPYFEIGNIDTTAYQRWATRIAAGEWWPAGTFYQSPLYAYFLAVLYRTVGSGPWSPRVVQVIAGSLSPALVYAIGSRLFSRRVGWIAGLGLALYGPIVLEEITFSKTTLLVVTALAAFALYVSDGGRRLRRRLVHVRPGPTRRSGVRTCAASRGSVTPRGSRAHSSRTRTSSCPRTRTRGRSTTTSCSGTRRSICSPRSPTPVATISSSPTTIIRPPRGTR